MQAINRSARSHVSWYSCGLQVDRAGSGADFELCDHIISFINAALTSPEAQSDLALLKRFTNALLDKGLPLPPCCVHANLQPTMHFS